VKERLVEDWLINAGERGFEIPFCQILLAKGYRVLRVSHSPYEHGKDVLALTPKGELHAYQLKQGDIDLRTFEKHGEQIRALVEADIEHPGVPHGKIHKAFFVTTGTIKDPVVDRIVKMNASWKRRRLPTLMTMDAIITNNNHRAESGLATPYKEPDEVFSELFERSKRIPRQPVQETKESYALESLVTLASRRTLRQHLSRRWRDISWVSLGAFVPKRRGDYLLWRCNEGLEREAIGPTKRKAGAAFCNNHANRKPQSCQEFW
jgi:hypothetical protein